MTCCKVWQWRFVHLYVNMCMIMKKESTRVFRFGKNNKPPSPQVTICRRGSCSKIVVPLRRMSYRADHSGIMRKKTFNILRRKNAGLENDCKNQVEKKTALNAVPGSSVVRMFFVRTSGLWLVPGAVKYRILQQRVLHWFRSGHCSSALVYLGIPNRGISQAGLNVCGKITWKHRRLIEYLWDFVAFCSQSCRWVLLGFLKSWNSSHLRSKPGLPTGTQDQVQTQTQTQYVGFRRITIQKQSACQWKQSGNGNQSTTRNMQKIQIVRALAHYNGYWISYPMQHACGCNMSWASEKRCCLQQYWHCWRAYFIPRFLLRPTTSTSAGSNVSTSDAKESPARPELVTLGLILISCQCYCPIPEPISVGYDMTPPIAPTGPRFRTPIITTISTPMESIKARCDRAGNPFSLLSPTAC